MVDMGDDGDILSGQLERMDAGAPLWDIPLTRVLFKGTAKFSDILRPCLTP